MLRQFAATDVGARGVAKLWDALHPSVYNQGLQSLHKYMKSFSDNSIKIFFAIQPQSDLKRGRAVCPDDLPLMGNEKVL